MALPKIFSDALHLFYPDMCIGCGSDLVFNKQLLCTKCISDLPVTGFENYPLNMMERIFTGRINLRAGHSEFYFSKGRLIQHLIHELKYNNNTDIGIFLGEFMGEHLLASSRFSNIDYLVPLPLFADKEFKRGYNQAEIICRGVSRSMNVPVLQNNINRIRNTETQTRKHRLERWQNVEGGFRVSDPACITGKNILLIDDVITTGATLEACAQEVLQIPGVTVSFATLAIATK